VLVLRCFLDGTRLAQLARDNTIGNSTNALLKTTFKALRRVSLSPDVIGAIAAALVLLHTEPGRTT